MKGQVFIIITLLIASCMHAGIWLPTDVLSWYNNDSEVSQDAWWWTDRHFKTTSGGLTISKHSILRNCKRLKQKTVRLSWYPRMPDSVYIFWLCLVMHCLVHLTILKLSLIHAPSHSSHCITHHTVYNLTGEHACLWISEPHQYLKLVRWECLMLTVIDFITETEQFLTIWFNLSIYQLHGPRSESSAC